MLLDLLLKLVTVTCYLFPLQTLTQDCGETEKMEEGEVASPSQPSQQQSSPSDVTDGQVTQQQSSHVDAKDEVASPCHSQQQSSQQQSSQTEVLKDRELLPLSPDPPVTPGGSPGSPSVFQETETPVTPPHHDVIPQSPSTPRTPGGASPGTLSHSEASQVKQSPVKEEVIPCKSASPDGNTGKSLNIIPVNSTCVADSSDEEMEDEIDIPYVSDMTAHTHRKAVDDFTVYTCRPCLADNFLGVADAQAAQHLKVNNLTRHFHEKKPSDIAIDYIAKLFGKC